MIVVTSAEMQSMDRKTIENFGIPGRILMESAGRGATRCFLERVFKKVSGRVGVVAGRGNNGGDGFVIARYLAQKGIDVRVYLLTSSEKVRGDAEANLRLLAPLNVPVVEMPGPGEFARYQNDMQGMDYWVDAILGTGLKSDVKGYFRQVIEFINSCRRPVLAVDIPSGVNADNGQPCGTAIQATATATFAYCKIGHLVFPGARLCGTVDVIDIGIPPLIEKEINPRQQMITAETVQGALSRRPPDTHKGRTGHLLVVAGAKGKTGAAAMTAATAMRAGAGLVTLAVAESLNPIMEAQLTEAMTVALPDQNSGLLTVSVFNDIARTAEGKACLALGPGMGTADTTRELVNKIVREIDIPLVIDADGLNNLAVDLKVLQNRRAPVVLTPHPGEMARLTGDAVSRIQHDRVTAARTLAGQCGAFVLLKGARTIVAAPDGRVWINPTGNPGMASGGMGDVLTGLVAGLMAQGCSPAQAATAGAFLHGLAADILSSRTEWGFLATDVMLALPQAMQRVKDDPPPPPVQSRFL